VFCQGPFRKINEAVNYSTVPLPFRHSSAIVKKYLLHQEGLRGVSPDDARQPVAKQGGKKAAA